MGGHIQFKNNIVHKLLGILGGTCIFFHKGVKISIIVVTTHILCMFDVCSSVIF